MSTVIKVFLASPSDLQDERRIVRARAEQFNNLWSDEYGVYFRIVGWEDLPPVAQRPQHRINRDADDCQVFIGMLAKRWGSSTGEFSSGFEEEFFSAQKRWKSCGNPEIALFFKTLDTNMLSDAGPQLSKVLQFKNSIIEGKELLFKEFSNASDLSDFVDAVFAEYAKTRKEQSAVQPGVIEQKSDDSFEEHAQPDEVLVDASSIASVLTAAREGAANEANDKLDFWGRLRLLVYSTAKFALSREHISIGTHEANLVFRRRKEWALTNAEQIALIKAMLSDAYHYTPGWYWLAETDLATVRKRLWFFCQVSADCKKGAAAILANDLELPSDLGIVRNALLDQATAPSICQLLERLGTREILPAIAEAKAAANGVGELLFTTADFAIRLRCEPELQIESIVEYAGQGVEAAFPVLRERIKLLDAPALTALLASASEGQRREALVHAMLDTEQISIELAELFIKDLNKQVRKAGTLALIAAGRPFTRADLNVLFPEEKSKSILGNLDRIDIDALVKEGLRLLPLEDLKNLVGFFELDGASALEVLAELDWLGIQEEIARQLDSEFQYLLEESEERGLQRHGISLLGIWSKDGNGLVEYLRSKFVGAALIGVHRNGHPRAAEWAKKFCDQKYPIKVRAVAFDILLQLGLPLDYAQLLLEFTNLPSELAIRLLPAIFKNTQVDAKVIEAIATHSSPSVRDALRESLIDTWCDGYASVLEPLLLSDDDKTRKLTALVLSDRLGKAELENILDRYIELPTYFYDVATICDGAIYAIPPFREKLRVAS